MRTKSTKRATWATSTAGNEASYALPQKWETGKQTYFLIDIMKSYSKNANQAIVFIFFTQICGICFCFSDSIFLFLSVFPLRKTKIWRRKSGRKNHLRFTTSLWVPWNDFASQHLERFGTSESSHGRFVISATKETSALLSMKYWVG